MLSEVGINAISLSTHDLTRRSTEDLITCVRCYGLSTHDLTRRSTLLGNKMLYINDLSTHDLTRRSTWMIPPSHKYLLSFNSRPHKEVDNISMYLRFIPDVFQLTTSQGGRRSGFHSLGARRRTFNSRPHKEVDQVRGMDAVQYFSFNSRPHKEVDSASHTLHAPPLPFNSRPHKEVDAGCSSD